MKLDCYKVEFSLDDRETWKTWGYSVDNRCDGLRAEMSPNVFYHMRVTKVTIDIKVEL